MHENVLQPFGQREPLSQKPHHYGNSFFLDDLISRGKTSAVVQPLQPLQTHHTQPLTPEKPGSSYGCDQFGISPVLPGTGNLTHNVTRMLFESTPSGKSYQTLDLPEYYSKEHDLKHVASGCSRKRKAEDDDVDVEGDPQDHLRTSDLPNTTDSSISTQDSSSPTSSANLESPRSTSPGSGSDITSPDVTKSQPTKKKARTNYSPEQIQTLLKIFHENPYPDSEMMETIGNDFGVPEKQIKIWFQNKRARWRRRVESMNNNMSNNMQPFMSASPMMSPVTSYGFMPSGHMTSGHMTPAHMAPMAAMSQMMRTSPPHGFPGYFNMPWMQGQVSPTGNQSLSTNELRYPQMPQHTPMTSQQISPSAFPVSSVGSQFSTRLSPQQMVTSQNGRQLQYSQFMYPTASAYQSTQ